MIPLTNHDTKEVVVRSLLFTQIYTYPGLWYTYPSEKWWSSSVGMMTFPIYELVLYTGWWCNNHLEKYGFVNGKDYPNYPIYYGK